MRELSQTTTRAANTGPSAPKPHDVDVAPAGENVGRAVAHDADDQKRRLRPRHGAVRLDDERRAEDVPIGVAFVDVRLGERRDAIDEHRARVGVDQPRLEAVLVVLRRGDFVEAVLGEERRPVRQRAVVDTRA